MAYVVPEKQATLIEEDIIEHCRNFLASYKKPKHVVFIEEIPKNLMGKFDKVQLLKMWQAASSETLSSQ